ncbi:MAG TPA: hypothetical protein PKA90_17215, partial [Ignavibacteria bacterium]|nr:hypothetical protein [Ignavibacteria bacterium]HMR42160.1 hypothetical protein [Ignavibacteria bacterium]
MKKLFYLFSVIIISLMFFSGCSEDSSVNNPVEPPVPTGNIGGTIVSAPGEMIVNTNQSVLFRFTVDPGITFVDSIATLTKVDQSNNEIAQLGNLYDNGNLANGDEIANDNVFSGLININETSPGNILIRAKGKFSATEYKYSQVLTINVYAQITSQNFGTLMNTQENAKTQLQTYLAGNPGNIESAVNQLTSWLQTQPGVESVESDGTTSLMINYTSGLKGGLVFSVLNSAGEIETRGGFGGDTTAKRTAKIPVNKQTIGTNPINGNFSFHSGDNPPADPNAIGNRNVLIYAPFENAFAPRNERPNIINRLNQSGCKGFEITSLTNQEATVSAVNTFI